MGNNVKTRLTCSKSRKVPWSSDVEVAHPDVGRASDRVDECSGGSSFGRGSSDVQVDRLVKQDLGSDRCEWHDHHGKVPSADVGRCHRDQVGRHSDADENQDDGVNRVFALDSRDGVSISAVNRPMESGTTSSTHIRVPTDHVVDPSGQHIRRGRQQQADRPVVSQRLHDAGEEVGDGSLTLRHHVHEDQHPDLGVLEGCQERLPSAGFDSTLGGTGFGFDPPHGQVSLDGGEELGIVRIFWHEEGTDSTDTDGG